jgi:photosystem II stability/assembly factor-like uncharacterized protein
MLSRKEKFGILALSLCFSFAMVWFFYNNPSFHSQGRRPLADMEEEKEENRDSGEKPNDWFFLQRAYPIGNIPIDQRLASLEQAQTMLEKMGNKSAVVWLEAGPTNIPGRITDLAVHPSNPNTIYAGAAAGGVFKSTDNGVSWIPVFDITGTPSIGALAVHPTEPQIIYVGTGEANSSGDSYPGTGMYKSTDGGSTWTHLGLDNSYHIGRIAINPRNPEIIYAAVCGKLFGTNPDRGVYKSTDGGVSWERKLFVSDSTSCIDVVLNPSSPDTVYAAMWERIRLAQRRKVGGLTSGIWRSTDGGGTWSHLTTGLPASASNVGRIGISVSASSPNIVYAMYSDDPGDFMGVYKSTNHGANWARVNDSALGSFLGGYGWYFGNIRVDPTDANRVFVLGLDLYRSTNGGSSWSEVGSSVHVDHHTMFISPTDHNRVYLGCDGGVYLSSNGGTGWNLCTGQPSTQFYAITLDQLNPQRLYGGTQDNGTLRTLTGAQNDWEQIFGGDGFYCCVDFTNSNVIYAEYQWGNLLKSTNLGYSWDYVMNGINYDADRHNWCTPVVMDPTNHNILYYGSNRLYRTTNGGTLWSPISGDLTNGPGSGNLTYGTITTMYVAPSNHNVIYAGTDDANVWVTTNYGLNWTKIITGLPNRWVTRVVADPFSDAVVYVTLSGYRDSSPLPHIYRSTNHGNTWQSISSNLPEAPINDVVVDSINPSVLYVGSDVGVYKSENLGVSWAPLGINLPITTVQDLVLHQTSRKLVAGTHGRSMFSCQLASADTLHGVVVSAGPNIYTVNAIQVQAEFFLQNSGKVTDTFDITVTGQLAWDLNPDSSRVELNGGEIDTSFVMVTVPYTANVNDVDRIIFKAVSQANPFYTDQDTIWVTVAAKRGDANNDRSIDIGDVVFLINFLFKNGSAPYILDSGDVNCDGKIDVADVVYLINYLFRGGPAPCAP